MKNPITYDKITCFLCGGGLSYTVYSYTTNLFVGKEKFPIKSTLRLCEKCGLIFNNPRLSEKSLEWIYGTWYGADTALYGSEELERLNTTRLAFIKKHMGAIASKKVLDVGCGGGSFLALLKKHGAQVFGIEPSKDLRKSAKKQYDIEVYGGLLDASFTKKHQGGYDLVTFNEVLEHVYDPVEFLGFVSEVTSKYIYFDVPNTFQPRYGNVADFYGMEHISHFTKESVRTLARALGYEVIAIEEDTKDHMLTVLLKKGDTKHVPKPLEKKAKEAAIRNFKDFKTNREAFIANMKKKVRGHPKVIVYGAGRHTIQMIEHGIVDIRAIDAIVDSNPKKHGKMFMGKRIQSPNILKKRSVPVLISSFDSQEDISRYLTASFPRVSQITFYS